MGFFTIPLARLVGPSGKVIAVDIQEKMLNVLRRKAQRTGLSDRMTLLAAGSQQEIKEDSVDFVTALYVIHEIVDQPAFFNDMCRAMKSGARILVLEPRFHVAEKEFRRSVEMAEATGLVLTSDVDFSRRLSVVLSKP